MIPELFYTKCYDSKHRLFPRTGFDTVGRHMQKGYREPLLCEACEGAFSGYEDHAKRVFFGGVEIGFQRRYDGVRLSGIDYSKMKLFLMSLVWRMGVATGTMWSLVDLGTHEEILRRQLLAGDPGPEDAYPTLAYVPLFDGQHLRGFILQPDSTQSHTGTVYRGVFGGILFCFHVPSIGQTQLAPEAVLTRDGRWLIRIVDAMSIPFLESDLRRLFGK